MIPKAYGTFMESDGQIFRTEATLQWEDSEDLLGLIIMLNPGKSKLIDNKKWNQISNGETKCISGEIKLDHTMKSIVKILEFTHPSLNGKIKILNLFNLRNSESKHAIRTMKKLCLTDKYKSFMYSNFDDLHNYPWIWIGWGVKQDEILNKRKYEVLSLVSKQKIHYFALYSNKVKDNTLIYHPHPHNPVQREKYFENMIKQMNDYWSTK